MPDMADSPCSLDPQQLTLRIQDWNSLVPAVLGREQTAQGARLRFRVEPGLPERLVKLLDAERECCPALSFTVELTLDIRVPEELCAWVTATFARSGPVNLRLDPPGLF